MKRIAAFGLLIAWSLWCYGVGSWRTQKRWEKATADVAWHCVEQHNGPAEPQLNVHPKTLEQVYMVPTEEDYAAMQ
jgi:hypothetical protein